MKRLLLTILTIALSSNIFGQRVCGSVLDFMEMKKNDPKQYQLFM